MTDHALNERSDDFTATAADRFLCLLLLAEVLLIAVTWPLWTTVDRFPAVPLLEFLCDAPVFLDQFCAVVLCLTAIAGCAAVFISRWSLTAKQSTANKLVRPCLLIALLCGSLLAALNQHRLQPWHWLFILIAVLTLVSPAKSRITLFRLTLATIYLSAAASRWGPSVDVGMSRQVLTVLTHAVGGDTWMKNASFVLSGCVAMSVFEFLIGVLLLVPGLRRWGIFAAIGLHATLLFALSPLGLNHHFGVLIWNAFLLIAVPVLFAVSPQQGPAATNARGSTRVRLLAAFVVLFPLSGLFGVADNWLSWQVYSPRPEVVRVYVHQDFVDVLPAELLPFVSRPAPLEVWCPVRIDRWSLFAVAVPMYPEDRFQLAIARQMLQIVNDPAAIRIHLQEPDLTPWRPRRSQNIDPEQLGQRISQFLFNGRSVRTAG